MAKTLQHRRDTTANLASVTGAAGEIFIDTTKKTVVVMDGSTAGGFPLALEGAGSGATGPQGVQGATGPQGVQGASGVSGGGGGGSYASLTEDGGALTLTVDSTYELDATKATIGELYIQNNIITPLQVDSGDSYHTLIDQPVYINSDLTVDGNVKFGSAAQNQNKSYVRSDSSANILIGGGNLNSGVSNVANVENSYGSVRIGHGNGQATLTQDSQAIAIGYVAGGAVNGNQTQSSYSIAIGASTETWDGATRGIAIGTSTKAILAESIAIGTSASAGEQSVAIGYNAYVNEGSPRGVAIGTQAGTTQGITISSNGSTVTGSQGTIVLNAATTGGSFSTGINNAFYVDPVRAVTSTSGLKQMYYNPSSKEIVYYNV